MKREVTLVVLSVVVGFILGAGVLFFASSGSNVITKTIVKEPVILSLKSDALGDIDQTQPKQFDSYESLVNFLKLKSGSSGGDDGGFLGGGFGAEVMEMEADSMAPTASGGVSKSTSNYVASSYSQTNVQVLGVDEPDITKNDDKYIYTVSSGNRLIIAEAYPAEELKVVSEIDFSIKNDYSEAGQGYYYYTPRDYRSISNLFINGDKLVVFLNTYTYSPYSQIRCLGQDYCGGESQSFSEIQIYDVSDRSNPKLEHVIKSDGNYVDARMIGDYVYLVSSKYVNVDYPVLPVYFIDGTPSPVLMEDLYYFGDSDDSYVFTSVAAINVKTAELNSESYLVGYTSEIYASEDNIYLTTTKYRDYYEYRTDTIREAVLPHLPSSLKSEVLDILDDEDYKYNKFDKVGELVEEYYLSLSGAEQTNFNQTVIDSIYEYKVRTDKERTKTIIHRVSIGGGEIEHEASGEVPGTIHDQFSMDEYDGYFRIATTTGGWWWWGSRENVTNNVYVLDGNLEIVGSVEDLAEGESIFSARYMGEKLYLVTFRRIDPLFVIDLSKPTNPKVLGYLKIAGVSDYLHPYDEDHIIGIGSDADEDGRTTGLKVSIFDVSNVASPRESAKLVIGESGTYSEVQNDHKALLFDKDKNLLVIPVQERLKTVDEYRYSYWNGVYVIDIDSNNLGVRGKVTHNSNTGDYYYYQNQIRRSLYMDDVLYTVSSDIIKANDLTGLSEMNKVSFGTSEQEVYPYIYARGLEIDQQL